MEQIKKIKNTEVWCSFIITILDDGSITIETAVSFDGETNWHPCGFMIESPAINNKDTFNLIPINYHVKSDTVWFTLK